MKDKKRWVFAYYKQDTVLIFFALFGSSVFPIGALGSAIVTAYVSYFFVAIIFGVAWFIPAYLLIKYRLVIIIDKGDTVEARSLFFGSLVVLDKSTIFVEEHVRRSGRDYRKYYKLIDEKTKLSLNHIFTKKNKAIIIESRTKVINFLSAFVDLEKAHNKRLGVLSDELESECKQFEGLTPMIKVDGYWRLGDSKLSSFLEYNEFKELFLAKFDIRSRLIYKNNGREIPFLFKVYRSRINGVYRYKWIDPVTKKKYKYKTKEEILENMYIDDRHIKNVWDKLEKQY